MRDYENIIKHYDLYKEYGEFNFLFEDTIQEFRLLTIAIIRIAYEYFEEEDEDMDELPYHEQDRLLKILLNNMGAREIMENSKGIFIDFLNKQKERFGKFQFKWFEEERVISEESFAFALAIFKKTLPLIELRNIIIHSYYFESQALPYFKRDDLIARKDIRTSKGYENRNYIISVSHLEAFNGQIRTLQELLRKVRFFFYLTDSQQSNYKDELKQLSKISFVFTPNNK